MAYYFKCPSCEGNTSFRIPKEQASALPLLLLLIGQILAAVLLIGHRRGRIQCWDCGFIFRQPPPPKSPVSKFAHWIAFVMLLGLIAIIYAELTSIDSSTLPEIPVLLMLEASISTHLRLATFIVSIVFVLLLSSCIIVSFVSNHSFRRNHPDQIKVGSMPTDPTVPNEPTEQPAPQEEPTSSQSLEARS